MGTNHRTAAKPSLPRSRKKTILLSTAIFALFFFLYQFALMLFLDRSQSARRPDLEAVASPAELPRGAHVSSMEKYSSGNGTFECFDRSRSVPYAHVNDDYCDCEADGSDEPGTSACNAGRFYCRTQIRRVGAAEGGDDSQSVPSSRVNDGVCDCCDGSDEWAAAGRCKYECPN